MERGVPPGCGRPDAADVPFKEDTPYIERCRFGPFERDALKLDLDAPVREGARGHIEAALKAEAGDRVRA
jgi:hypothetical protein